VSQATTAEFKSVDLLFIGSPTQGGNATKAMQAFLNSIPDPSLKGVKAAAFDTRMTSAWVKIFGFAAGRIAKKLSSKGASLVGSPEGFFVTSTKGPLKNGEIERAAAWVKEILKG
jgi:flavodoxin I